MRLVKIYEIVLLFVIHVLSGITPSCSHVRILRFSTFGYSYPFIRTVGYKQPGVCLVCESHLPAHGTTGWCNVRAHYQKLCRKVVTSLCRAKTDPTGFTRWQEMPYIFILTANNISVLVITIVSFAIDPCLKNIAVFRTGYSIIIVGVDLKMDGSTVTTYMCFTRTRITGDMQIC